MFVYSVHLIIVVESAFVDTYSVHSIIVVESAFVDTYCIHSIIYRTGACISHPVLKEAAIL
jgi:hypothetical protein